MQISIDAKYLTLHNKHPHAKLMKLESNINHDYYSFQQGEVSQQIKAGKTLVLLFSNCL